MLDVSTGELLVILTVALILFGPDKLPQIARTMGKILVKVRRLSTEFRLTLEEMIRQAEEKERKEKEKGKAAPSATRLPAAETIPGTDAAVAKVGPEEAKTMEAEDRPEEAAGGDVLVLSDRPGGAAPTRNEPEKDGHGG